MRSARRPTRALSRERIIAAHRHAEVTWRTPRPIRERDEGEKECRLAGEPSRPSEPRSLYF